MASRDWPAKNLQNLERAGQLRPEPVDARELARYLASAGDFSALRANDYRTAQERGHRRLVFELLPHSCGARGADALTLVRAHEKRNVIEYDGIAEITEREVADIVAVAGRIHASVQAWLERHRPELLKR